MVSTLLLNATYEPLTIVPIRRAVVLVLAEKAELVEGETIDGQPAVFRGARHCLPVPRVIRLLRYVKVPYRRRVAFSKRAVLRRDRFRCAYCGGPATTVDHVIPSSRGGRDDFRNCVAACSACNLRKGDRLLAELGWTLPVTPTVPKITGYVVLGMVADPAWEPYLAFASA